MEQIHHTDTKQMRSFLLRMKSPAALIILFVNFIQISAQPDRIELSPAELETDFRLMREALEQVDPGMYRFTSEATFNALFDSIGQTLDHPMAVDEFYRRTMPLIARIKCGHVKYIPEPFEAYNYYFNTDRLFPLKLYFTDTSAIALKGFNNDMSGLSGSEILTINGQRMDRIRDKLFQYIAADGNVLSAKYSELNDYFSAYYANFIGASDTFRITCQLPTGDIADTSLASITMEEIPVEDLNPENNAPVPYELTFKEGIAIFTIASFAEESEEVSYRAYLNRSFRTVEEKRCKSIIIDLRNNEGGKDRRGALLLSYLMSEPFPYYQKLTLTSNKKYSCEKELKLPAFISILRLLVKKSNGEYLWTHHPNLKMQKPQKHGFDGDVIVLTNGRTFSVSSEFAAAVKSLKRATIVGEESGGTYEGNNSGTFAFATLPHTHITIGIPMLSYYMEVDPVQRTDIGVMPDYIVKPALEDLLDQTDTVTQFALRLARKPFEGSE